MNNTNETPKQYQCRHIFIDGRRCASPCLRHQEFCYYHHTTRKPIANPRQRRSRRSTFDLPLPEDRSAIQASIGQVLQRIASNDIDPRRAGLLLYGLQIASINLPKTQPAKSRPEPQPEPQTIEEIIIDPALGILAPRTEVGQAPERKSSVRLLMEKLVRDHQQQETTKQTPEPTTIPTLQAAAENPSADDTSPLLCRRETGSRAARWPTHAMRPHEWGTRMESFGQRDSETLSKCCSSKLPSKKCRPAMYALLYSRSTLPRSVPDLLKINYLSR